MSRTGSRWVFLVCILISMSRGETYYNVQIIKEQHTGHKCHRNCFATLVKMSNNHLSATFTGKFTSNEFDMTTELGIYTTEDVQQEAESRTLSYKVVVYSLIGIIGFIGNCFVVVIIVTTPKMRKKHTNWYLVQQSVLDSLGSLFMMFDALTHGMSLAYVGIGGELRCRLVTSGFLLWGFYMASTYNLVAITIDRYFEVVHAIYHKNHFTERLVILLLAIPWLASFTFGCTGLSLAYVVDGECTQFNFKAAWGGLALGWSAFLLQFFLPIVVMVYCYSKIAYSLRQLAKAMSSSNRKEEKASKATTNIVKTLVIVCLCFIVCWIWNSVLFLLASMGWPVDFGGWFYHFTVTAVNVNCIANPFIYTLQYREFKQAATKLLCRRLVKIQPDTSTLTASITGN